MASAEMPLGGSRGWRGNRGGSRRPWRDAQSKSAQARERPTHFISVPLDHLSQFTSQISHFTNSLLTVSPPITGLDRSIVISPSRLHLTLGVMSLATEDRPVDSSKQTEIDKTPQKSITDALALLRSLKPEIESALQGQPLQLCLNEFAVMRRSPAGEADVMYIGPAAAGAKTEEHIRSVKILETITRRFTQEGFITDTRPLKLHCTILNTTYRKAGNRNGGQRIPFSIAQIEDSIAQNPHITGTLLSSDTPLAVREMNICRMGSYDEFGRYVRVGGIEW
ncbi:hypothetical protein OPQ81_005398 [Rhizoctonia solani]|nr:hypothetical protein OPQ81_005398 [Rhizoctonia solani]